MVSIWVKVSFLANFCFCQAQHNASTSISVVFAVPRTAPVISAQAIEYSTHGDTVCFVDFGPTFAQFTQSALPQASLCCLTHCMMPRSVSVVFWSSANNAIASGQDSPSVLVRGNRLLASCQALLPSAISFLSSALYLDNITTQTISITIIKQITAVNPCDRTSQEHKDIVKMPPNMNSRQDPTDWMQSSWRVLSGR